MTRRPLLTLARRLPWPARAAVGVAAVVLGLTLISSPFRSLDTLAVYLALSFVAVGVADLVRSGRGRTDLVMGVAWCLLGVVVLLAPGHLIRALPVVSGVALVVAGVHRTWRARTGATDDRWVAGLLGAAQVVLGVLALAWHDVTLVAAALFGLLVTLSGATLAYEAVFGRREPSTPTARGPVRRWGRVVAAGTALVVALGLLVGSGSLKAGRPRVDAFYTAPSNAPTAPGRLLRAESFTTEVPSGARAWRILYTTTDALGKRAVASGIVVVPDGPATSPHPVIAWAHGTTGYARQCAPSVLKEPFTAGAFPAVMDQVMSNCWAVVATDYAGLGTAGPQPYLIGKGEAQSVLDAVRAARQLTDTRRADKTVVWGHSQGGGAALWSDQEQPTYAPDVPLLGTVAMAPAADPEALAKTLTDVTGGSVFGSFVVIAYADTYPDLQLRDFVRPAAIPFVRKLAGRCLSEPEVLASALTALSLRDEDLLSGDPSRGAFGAHLRANIARDPGPGPLLIAQGRRRQPDRPGDHPGVRRPVAQGRPRGAVHHLPRARPPVAGRP